MCDPEAGAYMAVSLYSLRLPVKLGGTFICLDNIPHSSPDDTIMVQRSQSSIRFEPRPQRFGQLGSLAKYDNPVTL